MPITRVVLTEPETAAPDAKQLSINAPSYRLKTLIMEYKNEVEEADFIPTTESVLVKQTHTYEVGSTYANYLGLLDDVKAWDTSIFIGNSSYDFASSQAIFVFDVYSIYKIEESSDKEYYGDFLSDSYVYYPSGSGGSGTYTPPSSGDSGTYTPPSTPK
jgi:hypothetical protein